MTETKVNEKKVVSRNVAIALELICVVLVASLVGGFGFFFLVVNDKDNLISSLNAEIHQLNLTLLNIQGQVGVDNLTIQSLTNQLTNLLNQITSDNSTLANLTDQVNELTYMLTHNSSVLFSNQTVDIFTGKWGIFVLHNYTFTGGGYVGVQVSGSLHTYVNFAYSSNGENYDDYRVNVGTGGIAVLPISAMTYLYIYVGTWDDSTPMVAITVTYYY